MDRRNRDLLDHLRGLPAVFNHDRRLSPLRPTLPDAARHRSVVALDPRTARRLERAATELSVAAGRLTLIGVESDPERLGRLVARADERAHRLATAVESALLVAPSPLSVTPPLAAAPLADTPRVAGHPLAAVQGASGRLMDEGRALAAAVEREFVHPDEVPARLARLRADLWQLRSALHEWAGHPPIALP